MRVTSDFFVSALLRRIFSGGGYGAIVRRGASEAGAIFLVARGRDGSSVLYGPAPQSAYDEARPDERLFGLLMEDDGSGAVDARLERELRFDPDAWVVEVEPGGDALAELVTLRTP